MKHLLYLLTVVLFFAACSKDDEPKRVQLDPNAMISIRPDESFQLKSVSKGLTPRQICEQAMGVTFTTYYNEFDQLVEEPIYTSRGFLEEHKDYDNNILKMWGTDVITQRGDLTYFFLEAKDVYIVTLEWDTIAHIPNETLIAVKPLIEEAYEEGDYTEVYRLFNEAYVYRAME